MNLNNNTMPNNYLLFSLIIMFIYIVIIKIDIFTKKKIEDTVKHQSKEYLRGYNIVCKLVENGSDIIVLLRQSEESLTNDHFDKGWREACLAHIKSKK